MSPLASLAVVVVWYHGGRVRRTYWTDPATLLDAARVRSLSPDALAIYVKFPGDRRAPVWTWRRDGREPL